MPSYQQSAGSGKAAKFVSANPLNPIANPFSSLNDSQKEYQEILSENVNKRLIKAMGEIKEKHERLEKVKAANAAIYQGSTCKNNTSESALKENVNPQSDDDSEDEFDDEDEELQAIRLRRIKQLQKEHQQKAENLSKGHGQYRTIFQDDFLTECCSSEYVSVHFYHDDFERCKIMDFHLKKIAPTFINCKFTRINAEKAPFFVEKLQIKTLPTLILFKDGKSVDRLVGFQGLALLKTKPDVWSTSRLLKWLANTNAIKYEPTKEDLEEENNLLLSYGNTFGEYEDYEFED